MALCQVFRVSNEYLTLEMFDVELERPLGETAFHDIGENQLKREFTEMYPQEKVLDISARASIDLGRLLRGPMLKYTIDDEKYAVDLVYLSCQKFLYKGPYKLLLQMTVPEAYTFLKRAKFGRVLYFKHGNQKWKIEQAELFYQWLYLNALHQSQCLANEVLEYDAFATTPNNQFHRYIYCQENQAAALYVLLHRHQLLETALQSPNSFIVIMKRVRIISKPTRYTLSLAQEYPPFLDDVFSPAINRLRGRIYQKYEPKEPS